MTFLPLSTRESAGRILAGKLSEYASKPNTLVLALVRGGVAVASPLAKILSLPLYPYIVRKIGHPYHREYGLGALAEGGTLNINQRMVREAGIAEWELEKVIKEEREELRRRAGTYAVHARPALSHKTVILVDDGAATGVSMFACIEDVKRQGVREVVIALPVAPPDTVQQLRSRADKVVVLATPEPFDAVGRWYKKFDQVEDDQVVALLQQ